MNFTPINEEEYVMRNVWPKGWYPCTVQTCEEGTSQKGNSFLKCEIDVYSATGAFKRITNYIMVDGKAAWQLRAAAEAFGLLEQYRAGALQSHEMVGKSAFVKVGIDEDKTGQYPPKNVISDYRDKLPKKAEQANVTANVNDQPSTDIDDNLPF